MKLSDYVFDFVASQGVKNVFMLPGGGAMHLVDSLGRNKKLSFVCNLHEQASAIAADAYCQYTSNLGVALVTTGPGGTNTITGVAGAWLDSIPVLFISGQVKRPDMIGDRKVRQMGFQEVDIISLVKPITKYAVTATNPEDIRYHMEKAVHLARTGRPGPVWIDIPLDVQAAEIDKRTLRPFVQSAEKPSSDMTKAAGRAVKMINRSERPAILLGNGVRLSGAEKTFRRLAEKLNIPVLLTWKAMDMIPEDHPLNMGRPGAVGQRGANFVQQNCDLLIVIGARLDLGQTAYNHSNFAHSARKIMVDVDPHEIAKMDMKIDLKVKGDAACFTDEMLKNSGSVEKKDRSFWLGRCREWKNKYPVVLEEYRRQKGFVNDYVLIDILSDEMTPDDLLIPGSSGACSERSMQAFKVREGMRVFNSEGLGSMGFGIPMAIGGCIASGGRRTVCIDGDGGFAMNVQELETVRRLNLPIKFFVLNNRGYVSIQNTQRNYFDGRYVASTGESGLTLPDYKKVAAAFGIPALRIKDHRRIRENVKRVLETEGPVVCEVMVSPDQPTAPRVSSEKRPDGTMVSHPMEDLWPFLDRKEFEANMMVTREKRKH